VASALQRAGLDIGRDLAGPALGNPRGHFEDQDFFRLHEDMLGAAGETCFTAGDDFALPESPELERRARALAAEREALPLWGWKDPRTCLFLELWDRILPDARYLFVYRHPVDVALSLWRRNKDLELRQDPWLAMRAWEVYNRRLLDFRRRHPERCFLAQVPALTADLGGLVRRLGDELGLPLREGSNGRDGSPGCDGSVFAPDELMPPTPPSPAWEARIPGALALYRRLEESADLPAREAPAPAAPRPARERELLRASETLFYALLETRGPGGPAPPTELRRAYHDLREQEEKDRARIRELEAALAREQQGRAMAERVLAEIEGARSFAPVRGWWRLRRRLGKRRE